MLNNLEMKNIYVTFAQFTSTEILFAAPWQFFTCSQKNFIMVKTHIYCTIESVVVFFFAKSTEILDYSKFRIILHRENKTSKTLPILILMSICVFLLAIPDRINSIYLVLCMTYTISISGLTELTTCVRIH
jgi:hypothetical protein